MKTVKLFLLVIFTLSLCNCTSFNSRGLHSGSYIFKQPRVKSNSLNNNGLYGSNQKVAMNEFLQ